MIRRDILILIIDTWLLMRAFQYSVAKKRRDCVFYHIQTKQISARFDMQCARFKVVYTDNSKLIAIILLTHGNPEQEVAIRMERLYFKTR